MADHSNEEEESFYYQNTSSTFKSGSKKNENAVTQYAEGKAIICIQCSGRSKEGCEILSSLLSTRGYARTHTPRANI